MYASPTPTVTALTLAAASLLANVQTGAFAAAAPAPGLYGVGPFLVASQFLKLDTSTGAATVVGPTHWDQWSGISLDPAGRILGVTFNGSLHEIDPATGLASMPVRQLSLRTFYEGDFAINPGTGQAYSTWGSSLLTVDLTTGDVDMSAPLTFQGNWLDSQANIDGLAFRDGSLYGFVTLQQPQLNGHLIRIDPATLTVTDVGPTGLSFGPTAGLAYNPIADVFYVAGSGLPGLYRLDPNTAAATLIGNTGQSEITGLVFVAPEPISLSLSALAASLFSLARPTRRPRATRATSPSATAATPATCAPTA